MTDDLVARLRDRLAKATPPPWFSNRVRGHNFSEVWAGTKAICSDGFGDDDDADLICDLRNNAPALLDEIERLRAENARLREALNEAWTFSVKMRHANKLVGPYETDRAKTRVWVRSLYHEGRELQELLKPYRAALAAPPATGGGWQPIETAPHNKSVLLGWHDWRDGRWCMTVDAATTGERLANGYSSLSQHGSATHWMPLPAPPATEEKG